jgi:hypothetical protein
MLSNISIAPRCPPALTPEHESLLRQIHDIEVFQTGVHSIPPTNIPRLVLAPKLNLLIPIRRPRDPVLTRTLDVDACLP